MPSVRERSLKATDLLEQLTHTGDGVFAVDLHHRIILWNQGAESLLGYSVQEVLGRHCHDVIQARNCTGVSICGKQCSHFEEARHLRWLPNQSFCARSKEGTDIWIDVTTLSVVQRGKLSILVHIFRNSSGPNSRPGPELKLPDLETKLVSESAFQTNSREPRDEKNEGNAKAVPLTRRELAVLRYLAGGMRTQAIAGCLYISPTTVRNHVQSILRKLGVHSRLEAIALVFHRKLVHIQRSRPTLPPAEGYVLANPWSSYPRMMNNEPSLLDIVSKFNSEEDCVAKLERIRWPDGLECPRCKSKRISKFTTKRKTRKPRHLYTCIDCRYQYSVTVGTVFHDSHLPLAKWFLAIHMICSTKNVLSARQLQRELHTSYETAWYMAYRIRLVMQEDPQFCQKFSGLIEVDGHSGRRSARRGRGGPYLCTFEKNIQDSELSSCDNR